MSSCANKQHYQCLQFILSEFPQESSCCCQCFVCVLSFSVSLIVILTFFCFLNASIALFRCFCTSFLYFSLTLLYSSLTHWLAHCYYLYFPKCSSPPFLSLSPPPPFTLSTLSEGAILINASALKVTTCIQLQGLFLSESHLRPCLLPHQGANQHLVSALRHVFARAKNILNAVCKRECLVNASQGRSPLVNT